MKRDATGKFVRNWDSETKRRVSVTLTSTAWRLLEEAAWKRGISRSEVIEHIARSFAIASSPPLDTEEYEQGEFLNDSNLSCPDGNSSGKFDSNEEEAQAQWQQLIWQHQQTIATLQRQKHELEALLEQEQQRTQRLVTQETERKQAEQTLRNTAERLSLALAAAKLGHWSWDAATDLVTFSERAAELFGIPPGPHMTWTQMCDLLHETDQERVRVEVERAIANHSDYRIEYRVRHQDGSECWVAASGQAHYSATGEVIGMLGVVQDITQRKQLETKLQNQKQQFEMLAENAPDIIARFDANFRHLYVSPSIERATGLPATAFIGKTNVELDMPKGLCLRWHHGLEQVFATGQEHQIEFQFSTPDGKRWYQSRLVPEFAVDGSIESVLGITRDFDDYKQAEQALRQSEERLRFALEAAGMVAWEWNLATGEAIRSHTALQILGLDSDTVSEGEPEFFTLIHPDDRDSVMQVLEQAIAQKSSYCAEFRLIKSNGSLRWMFDQGRVICNDAGDAVCMSGVIQDITDRKQLEMEREQLLQQLEASLGQFEAVINSMTEGLLVSNAEGNVLLFNPAALMLHEYDSVEQVRRHLHEFPDTFEGHDLQGNSIPLEEWPLAKVLRGQTYRDYEINVHRLDTDTRWIGSFSGTPVRDKQGQIILAVVTMHDITDRKQVEAERLQLLEQERKAREQAEAANRIKDEFLAVLSHELRTPLNPILGWSRLLRQGRLDANKTAAALATIERNAKLQIQLIDDLLDISRILQGKISLNSAPVDLTTTITAAIETVQLAAEAKAIHIQTHFASKVNPVLGDAARLQQVVWNLLTNALKFTPSRGRVDIRLSSVPGPLPGADNPNLTQNNQPQSHNQTQLTNYAQITVTDTGRGIRPEFLSYVFDTFCQADSTTTRTFGGLGLGLAIVRYLVELHGGMVKAESAGEGQGATFTVILPLMSAPVSPPQGAVVMSDPLHLQGVHILAVDDEVDNLELVQFILEQAGATVVAVSLATEALEKLHQAKPHLIIADIAMPRVDGYTLIQQIRELPAEHGGQIPAIALTAYASEVNHQQALAAGFQRHLSKPVAPETLVQAVSELLHQP